MKLAWDLDGVFCNFNFAYAKKLLKVGGAKQLPSHWENDTPPCWQWDEYYGYTQGEINKAWQEHIINSHVFWKNLPPMEDAPAVCMRLQQLSNMGHDVYFLTNRMGLLAKRQTERWLYEHGVTFPTVILTTYDKGPVLKEIRADMFIDDKLDTVIGAEGLVGKECQVFLRDANYNQVGRPPHIKSVSGPKEALERVGLWQDPYGKDEKNGE